MRFFALILVLIFCANVRAEFPEKCEEPLAPPTRSRISREARGYSILVATMVASAAGTTYLSSLLPSDFAFMSQFVGQVSTLGVLVAGAPIWEPLASGFRKLAFGVNRQSGARADGGGELMWRRTQETLSLNEQMSRNVRVQALVLTQNLFFEAYRAYNSREENYAATQLATAAIFLREEFPEVLPEDPRLALAVRGAFTLHVSLTPEFVSTVRARLLALDPMGTDYHSNLLRAWFNLKE